MMDWKTYVTASALALALHTNASAQASVQIVEASRLQTAPVQVVIDLTEQITWVRRSESWRQRDLEQGLLPGKYGLQLKDANGVYHIGQELAVYLVDRNSVAVFRGGVFIPNSPTMPPRLFAVEEGSPRRGKTLAEAISSQPPGATFLPLGIALIDAWAVEANRGNLVLFQEIRDEVVAARLRTIFNP
jgi:hypothetical protein